ncbi:hypothetical protein KKJ01_14180 [Xenorhabdus bovienii]|uniref:Uncharacterized protein n=1 Tax=Xenorhabdus bovienii TaxID=40576 RepID=A0AAJ1JAU9_XENBV|nr:hypothetical protein [Xenorhabdus bovienii]MDE1479347.1 hypothetical protein [Xenorhabdus bovienii]MDE9511026.1 hypothetical protein [Xenorhabdus bovienii]MDE9522683.1 hypothetical protein [Xenorhabdus bovienii]
MAKPHVHADLMMEYAKLAQETDRPWEHFEVFYDDADRWCSLAGEFYFDPDKEYRLKPRTIRIGNIDVPEPVREELKHGTVYYYPNLYNMCRLRSDNFYMGTDFDKSMLQRGLIHLDRESAEIHAKALIALTANNENTR